MDNINIIQKVIYKYGYVKFEVGTVHSPGWNHEVMN